MSEKIAVNDGKTHYALCLNVKLDSGYKFSKGTTKIIFNDTDVTSKGNTTISTYSWGGYVYIDLGLATGENITTYTVTFDSNGGSSIDSQIVSEGGYASTPILNPTKSGYAFDGWYSDKELSSVYDFSTGVTDNITLFANWKELETISELRIESSTTQVLEGLLPAFEVTTTTEHAKIEDMRQILIGHNLKKEVLIG